MTSEAPALPIPREVPLPMPVPPPVTMPTLLAKDAMSPPPRGRRRVVMSHEQHGHDDQVPSIPHETPSARDPRHRIRGIPSRQCTTLAGPCNDADFHGCY